MESIPGSRPHSPSNVTPAFLALSVSALRFSRSLFMQRFHLWGDVTGSNEVFLQLDTVTCHGHVHRRWQ